MKKGHPLETILQSKTSTRDPQLPSHPGSLVCWRSVLAGVLVASLAYMILVALGAGIGGLTAAKIIEKGENGSGLATGAGLWMGASAIVSLFLGSYFATRFSEVTHKQVGACQSIVIAAIFFLLMINGTGSMLGSLSGVSNHLADASVASDADAAAAARVVGDTGWLLFVTFILGLASAILGGIEGATGNLRKPFSRMAYRS